MQTVDIPAATMRSDGAVFFGTNGGGPGSAYRVRGGNAERRSVERARKIGVVARGDRLYISDPLGLEIVDAGHVETIGSAEGLAGGGPLLLDREGSLWLGTPAGLLQFPEPETITWGARHGLNVAHGEHIGVAGSRVWFSMWQGLGLLERAGTGWQTHNIQDTYMAAAATPMCVDRDGSLWLQTRTDDGRNALISTITGRALRRHRRIQHPMDCYTTGNGAVVLLGRDSVYRAVPGRDLESMGVQPPHDGTTEVRIAGSDDGVLHVARATEVCDAVADSLRAVGPSAWTCVALPAVGQVRDVAVVKGPEGRSEVWVASFSSGVVRRVAGEWRIVEAMRSIPQRATNGLFNSPRGGVWAFGFGFVVRLAPVGGQWEIVERLGGWQGVAGEIRSLWEEPDGTIWLASWRGVTRVPASARVIPGHAPATQLVALHVDGEDRHGVAEPIPHDHRVVEIEFAAAALRDPRQLRYQVRLDGIEWTETREPVLRLAGISPGQHEIEAAASLDGVTWGPSRVVQFRVAHPWYANGWALAAGAALLLGTAIVAHRLRTARLIDLERQRTRIAMDLHDELGAGLGSLGILGSVVADESAPQHERKRLGEQIARTAAELGGSLHDIVYSLRTGEARIESLAEQLASRGRTLFSATGVRFQMAAHRPQGVIAPTISRHAYRIGVEALHNAARHAEAACVQLGIETEGRNGTIRIWVQDDGRGIEPGVLAEPGGMGLVTMRRRAEAIGGALTIDSRPDSGTRVELHFDAHGRRNRWSPRQ